MTTQPDQKSEGLPLHHFQGELIGRQHLLQVPQLLLSLLKPWSAITVWHSNPQKMEKVQCNFCDFCSMMFFQCDFCSMIFIFFDCRACVFFCIGISFGSSLFQLQACRVASSVLLGFVSNKSQLTGNFEELWFQSSQEATSY